MTAPRHDVRAAPPDTLDDDPRAGGPVTVRLVHAVAVSGLVTGQERRGGVLTGTDPLVSLVGPATGGTR